MSFDNSHPGRKDWRRPYRRAGKQDRTCRPGGGCQHCAANRLHKSKRREPAKEEA